MELWEVPNASARLCVRKVNGFNELIPAHKVDVVDSTGAGDVLNGVFAATLNNNFSGLTESAIFASLAATLSVQNNEVSNNGGTAGTSDETFQVALSLAF